MLDQFEIPGVNNQGFYTDYEIRLKMLYFRGLGCRYCKFLLDLFYNRNYHKENITLIFKKKVTIYFGLYDTRQRGTMYVPGLLSEQELK